MGRHSAIRTAPNAAAHDTSEIQARHAGSALGRWGSFVGRHPGRIVATWVVLILCGFALTGGVFTGEPLFDRLHSGSIRVPGENQDGQDALDEAGSVAFVTYTQLLNGVSLEDPKTESAAVAAARAITALPDVASVASPWSVPGGRTGQAALAFVKDTPGTDNDGFAMVVTFRTGTTAETLYAALPAVDAQLDTLAEATGAELDRRGGVRQLLDAVIGQIKSDMKTGEGLALPVTFVVMILVFGGFLAAGLPIIGAIASISGALGTLVGFSYLMDLDATVVNVVTVLGLGLCIDYGLLMVSRYREELRGLLVGRPASDLTREQRIQAASSTLDRAGRTVLFSGLIVAMSLAGLIFFRADIVRAVGAAGVSVVVVALLVALSLVPALCVLSARRLLRKGTELAPDEGVFSRLARLVQRVPWLVIAAVTGALVVAALPALNLRLTASGPELLPTSAPERVFFETLNRDYPALAGTDVVVVARDSDLETVTAWGREVSTRPDVVGVTAPERVGDLITIGLRTEGGSLGDPARKLSADLRENRPPFPAYIVGQASGLADFEKEILARAPWAVGVVALATLILLFLMTGSVVIPIKALLMNVVSLGASVGVVVWVFQEGHLSNVLGFTSVGAVEQVVPILVLAFGFGLSMDYEVFLLSRIVELHEQGETTDRAVRLGLQRSGRIITSAAILMVIVFAGFVTAKVLVIKETGVALVLAIALDATLVRMLLVPATMTVLGNANWWAPAPLRRLHERFGITE